MRESKVDAISVVATPEVTDLLAEFKIGVNPQGFYELSKMTKEQYLRFRNVYCEQRLHKPVWMDNKNAHAMELLLRAFCMITCKKLPTEITHPPNLHTRLRLVPAKQNDKPVQCVLRLTPAMKKND